MLHITDDQVAELLDYSSVGAVLDQAFIDMARGAAAVHARQRTECAGVRLSTMGGVWHERGVAGVKVYPTVDGQFSFAILMFDIRQNKPLALLAGNQLTRLRTAAITALVASKVAAPEPRKLALFGAGLQGRSQAEALCQTFKFKVMHVVDPLPQLAWAEQLANRHGVEVRHTGGEEAVHDADIVVTATRSAQPVFNGLWLKPSCFISAMGTSTPKSRELDDVTLLRAQRVIVEWKPQSLAEAGEIVLWEGQRDLNKIVDLPQLYSAQQPWRLNEPGITVFKTVGIGLSDVAAAALAIARFQQRGLPSAVAPGVAA
jgi:ornithine cyclodeaminase